MSSHRITAAGFALLLGGSACQLLSGGSDLEVGDATTPAGGGGTTADGGGGVGGEGGDAIGGGGTGGMASGGSGGEGGAGGSAPLVNVCAPAGGTRFLFEGSAGEQKARVVVPTVDGGCILAGDYGGQFTPSHGMALTPGQHGFVLRIRPSADDGSAEVSWATHMETSEVVEVALGPNDDIYVVALGTSQLVLRLDGADGSVDWKVEFPGPTAIHDMVASAHGLWIGGDFIDTLGFIPPTLENREPLVNPDGGRAGFVMNIPFDYLSGMGESGYAVDATGDSGMRRLAVSPDGSVVGGAGVFVGDISAGKALPTATSVMTDVFLMQFGADAQPIELETFGSEGHDSVNGLAITDDDVVMAGTFEGDVLELPPPHALSRIGTSQDLWVASFERVNQTINWSAQAEIDTGSFDFIDIRAVPTGAVFGLVSYATGRFLNFSSTTAERYPVVFSASAGGLAGRVEVTGTLDDKAFGLHVDQNHIWVAMALEGSPSITGDAASYPAPPGTGYAATVLTVPLSN